MTHAPWLAQSRAFTAAAKVVVTGPAFAEPEVLFGDLTVLGSCFRYDLFPDPPGAQVDRTGSLCTTSKPCHKPIKRAKGFKGRFE
jgi:hypothetical protein